MNLIVLDVFKWIRQNDPKNHQFADVQSLYEHLESCAAGGVENDDEDEDIKIDRMDPINGWFPFPNIIYFLIHV